ncbi:MAG: 16S rRNA (adenine(1518)-N(6)/adenine(1519)-N(6))-dimethyltransferase RsmA, partial [Phycisphaeraceae bacterium]
IKQLLAGHGLHPKHRLGQNFLHDHNQMRKILAAAELSAGAPGDVVLEVGAGTGALTEQLLEAGAQVVAVEIDTDLEPILQDRLAPYADRVTLVLGDILATKRTLNPTVLTALSHHAPIPNLQSPIPAFKLIANLPYNVASPLLINLAVDHPAMTLGVVMIQREVADRLLAEPGNKQYGPLTVMVQAMCQVERISTLPPGCFWPPPKVDSAVIRLRRREQPLTDDPHALGDLLHRLFSRRRKQLGAILGRATALPADIDPNARPESLSVEQLVTLTRWLQ